MIKFPFLVGMMLASLAVWMYTRATPGAMSAGQAHAGSAAQKAESAASDAAAADPTLPPSPHNYGTQGSFTNQAVSYGDLGSGTSPDGSSSVSGGPPTTAIYSSPSYQSFQQSLAPGPTAVYSSPQYQSFQAARAPSGVYIPPPSPSGRTAI